MTVMTAKEAYARQAVLEAEAEQYAQQARGDSTGPAGRLYYGLGATASAWRHAVDPTRSITIPAAVRKALKQEAALPALRVAYQEHRAAIDRIKAKFAASKGNPMSTKITLPRSMGASLQQYGAGGDIYNQVGSHAYGGHAVERGKVQALLDKMDFDLAYAFRGDRTLARLRGQVRTSLKRKNPRRNPQEYIVWVNEKSHNGADLDEALRWLASKVYLSIMRQNQARDNVLHRGRDDGAYGFTTWSIERVNKKNPGSRSNPRAILFEVFDYKGVVQARVSATTADGAMRKFLKEHGIKGALFTGKYGVRRAKSAAAPKRNTGRKPSSSDYRYTVTSPSGHVTEKGRTEAAMFGGMKPVEVALDMAYRAAKGSRIEIRQTHALDPKRATVWRYEVVSTGRNASVRSTKAQ